MRGWNIVWHYHDLRIEDNPALVEAASGHVLPLFIYCPKEEGKWSQGTASNWWLHHSLQELSKEYQKLGTKLVIRSGSAFKVLEQLISEIPIAGVYWNQRYEPTLRKRDRKIAAILKARDIDICCFEGNYLITPSEILNKTGKPYSVFTPFSKTLLKGCSWRSPLPTAQINHRHRVRSEKIEDLKLLSKRQFSDQWTPGRKGALKNFEIFRKKVDEYSKQREIPSVYGTSRLSPHLHFGEISPHEIWKELEHKTKDRSPFLLQLIWREFGNYFLFHSPQATDHSWKRTFDEFPWNKSKQNLHAWQKGMTGYPIIDAGMRELWQTGWMHNRVRMIVGSFLVKDLLVHWIEGAKWFWKTLVDADLANNTLGWQWVAGCGPDAAPYFRVFNPVLQGKKFDPKGTYVRHWIPELTDVPDKWIHNPWEAPKIISDYPPPIVDHAEARQKALNFYKNKY